MTAELGLYLASVVGSLVVGWLSKHYGIVGGSPAAPKPVTPTPVPASPVASVTSNILQVVLSEVVNELLGLSQPTAVATVIPPVAAILPVPTPIQTTSADPAKGLLRQVILDRLAARFASPATSPVVSKVA